MMSNYAKCCMLLYFMVSYILEYVCSYTGMTYLYILTYIHAYTKNQKYSVWNWNELRREITSLDCSFHCHITLNELRTEITSLDCSFHCHITLNELRREITSLDCSFHCHIPLNELRREITSLDCSFHCHIPLSVKTIVRKEMKLFGNYLFSIRFVILYSKKKSMVIQMNIFVNFIH